MCIFVWVIVMTTYRHLLLLHIFILVHITNKSYRISRNYFNKWMSCGVIHGVTNVSNKFEIRLLQLGEMHDGSP